MSATVLIVEDDEAIAQLLSLQLTSEGYGVRVAPDGASCLEAVAMQRPDLVLLDVMMPDMDGWAVLRELRAGAETDVLPVIMLTSRSMPADEIRGRNLGADGYLTKPYSMEALLDAIEQVLSLRVERHPPADRPPADRPAADSSAADR